MSSSTGSDGRAPGPAPANVSVLGHAGPGNLKPQADQSDWSEDSDLEGGGGWAPSMSINYGACLNCSEGSSSSDSKKEWEVDRGHTQQRQLGVAGRTPRADSELLEEPVAPIAVAPSPLFATSPGVGDDCCGIQPGSDPPGVNIGAADFERGADDLAPAVVCPTGIDRPARATGNRLGHLVIRQSKEECGRRTRRGESRREGHEPRAVPRQGWIEPSWIETAAQARAKAQHDDHCGRFCSWLSLPFRTLSSPLFLSHICTVSPLTHSLFPSLHAPARPTPLLLRAQRFALFATRGSKHSRLEQPR